MKKRMTAVGLALAFMLSAVPFVQAAPAKPGTSVNVTAGVKVREKGETSYSSSFSKVAQTAEVEYESTLNMDPVKAKVAEYGKYADDIGAKAQLDNCTITGEFTITIDYPDTNFDISGITKGFDTTGTFNDLYVVESEDDSVNPATVKVKVKDGVKYSDLTTKLEDIKYNVGGVDLQDYGTYKVAVQVKGNTEIKLGGNTLADVQYRSNIPEATAILRRTSGGGGSLGGGGAVSSNVTVTTVIGNNVDRQTFTYPSGSDVNVNNDLPKEAPDGSKVEGYYYDRNYTNPVPDEFIANDDITIYGKLSGEVVPEEKHTLTMVIGEGYDPKDYEYSDGVVLEVDDFSAVDVYGKKIEGYYLDPEFTQPVEFPITLDKDQTVYIKWVDDEEAIGRLPLETEKHIAYIIGYPVENGREEVRPLGNITREEIVSAFYRLLKDEIRDQYFTNSNNFSDVDLDRWSNKAISTMANADYVNGYDDGTFGPARPITRAEFVTIATRIYGINDYSVVADAGFVDTADHWAKKYIDYAANRGWIEGYGANQFRPDQHITRAEAMKIINGMLYRKVDAEGIHEEAKQWVDNLESAWYYYEVLEATNAHTYDRAAIGEAESWTEVVENNVLIAKPRYENAN